MRQLFSLFWITMILFGSFIAPVVIHAQVNDFLPLPKNDNLDRSLVDNRIETSTGGETDFKRIVMNPDGERGIINPKNFNTAGAVVASVAVIYFVILGIQFFFSQGNDDRISKLKKEFINIILSLFMISSAFFIGARLLNPENSTPGIEEQDKKTFEDFRDKFWDLLEFLPQIVAGIALVMIMLSGFNMVLRGQEDDVVQREKTFLKSFIIGFAIFVMGLAIAQIASFNDRDLAGSPVEIEFDDVINQGYDRGNPINSSKQGVEEVVGIISYTLTYLSIVTLIMLLISSLYFIINFGDEERATRAKRLVFACAVGLIVSFSAYTLFRIFFVNT